MDTVKYFQQSLSALASSMKNEEKKELESNVRDLLRKI